jgi:hypothetical protein
MIIAAIAVALASAGTPWAATPETPAAPSEGAKKAIYPKPRDMDALVKKDPMQFLRTALKWSDDTLADYTCQFEKQERIGNELAKTETMQMKFRAAPFSVYVKWSEDPSKGQEALYVAGKNDNQVLVHPSGILGVLFRKVPLDPAGKLALKHSRRPITFAGMANMLRVIFPQCEEAQKNGDLELTYEGIRKQDGRPTYVLKRVLPNKNDYQCSVLVIYIDKEYLACVRTDAYDWEGGLISQYTYSNLVINPGLKDADFDPDSAEYGFRAF